MGMDHLLWRSCSRYEPPITITAKLAFYRDVGAHTHKTISGQNYRMACAHTHRHTHTQQVHKHIECAYTWTKIQNYSTQRNGKKLSHVQTSKILCARAWKKLSTYNRLKSACVDYSPKLGKGLWTEQTGCSLAIGWCWIWCCIQSLLGLMLPPLSLLLLLSPPPPALAAPPAATAYWTDHGIAPILSAPNSQSIAMKEFCFVPSGICLGDAVVKFLASDPPGTFKGKRNQ